MSFRGPVPILFRTYRPSIGGKFDGGYTEYALLPNSLLMPATTTYRVLDTPE
jgi:hypothetical protein